MIIAWAIAAAFAQDSVEPSVGYDAHGFVLAPNDGGALDGLSVWRAGGHAEGSWSASAAYEHAGATFVTSVAAGDAPARLTPVVADLHVANIALRVTPTADLDVSLALPVYLSAGGWAEGADPGVGDARLAAKIVAIPRPVDGSGLGVDVVALLDLPSGDPSVFLGNGKAAGGLLVAAGSGGPRWSVDGNLGVYNAPMIEYLNLRGGSRLLTGMSGSYAVSDAIGARLEATFRPALAQSTVRGSEAPGEATLSVGGRAPFGLTWAVGGAAPWTSGVGAAQYRAFVRIGYAPAATWEIGSPEPAAEPPADVVAPAPRPDAREAPRKLPDAAVREPDSDQDGVIDRIDVCPSELEVINGFADTDGCPDLLSDLYITLRAPDGTPVAGITARLDGQTAVTDAAGVARFTGLLPGSAPTVTAPGFAEIPLGPLPEGLTARELAPVGSP